MASININDLLEYEPQDMGSSYIKSARQDVYSHQVSFDKGIGEPHLYRDLINLLYMADESTEFNFFMNSPGGNLSAAMAIIEAIKGSDALVRAIVTGECHSAASLITLHCHEIIVTDSAHSLIHTASYGTGGNTHMVQSHVDFSTKMINKILQNTYSGFLSVSELGDVERGIELWMDADEIRARLEARREYLNKKEAKELKTSKVRTKAPKA
jgi:ATP-dependent protease ClpP protease subunit